MRVGGGEPKVRRTALTQATDVPEAIPPYEPPSPPLTPDDRHSVEQDLEAERTQLERDNDRVALPGLEWMLARSINDHEREIARLEQMLAEDNLAIIDQGCLAAVLAGGDTWQQFMADAEQRTGLPWAEIKLLLDERSANRTKATTS